jgi:1-acyl-sn-glycerol-3-phosphate acyltransferase
MSARYDGNPPSPPYLLVCNHLSFLDIFVLAARLGCVFVSRGDLAGWPVFGYIASTMDTLYIDRERVRDTVRVNREIQEVLARGAGVVIFPESRVAQENTVLPFKAALLEPAVAAHMPVYWAALRYATRDAGARRPEDVLIWKDGVSFFRHYLDVAGLARSEVRVAFGESPVHARDRRELAAELQRRVAEHFVPVGLSAGER